MSAGSTEEVVATFARATELMEEARQRLDQLGAADVEVQSIVDEARRVNGGLLQVLSVLLQSADQAVANQKALSSLIESSARRANIPAGNLSSADAVAIAEAVVESLPSMPSLTGTAEAELGRVLQLLEEPPAPSWLPTLHQFISGSSTIATERAVAPLVDAVEALRAASTSESVRPQIDALQQRLFELVPTLTDSVSGLLPQITEDVRSGIADHLRSTAPSDAVLVRLDAIEQSVKAIAAKREALPRAVGEGMASVLERLEEIAASQVGLATSVAKISAKQNAMDKRLAQLDDGIMEMAKDIEDVHAIAYAPTPDVFASSESSRSESNPDVLPQRIRRRLFGN